MSKVIFKPHPGFQRSIGTVRSKSLSYSFHRKNDPTGHGLLNSQGTKTFAALHQITTSNSTFEGGQLKTNQSHSKLCLSGVEAEHTITIKILSNYGHSSLVAFSEIDILNQSRLVIPVNKIYYKEQYDECDNTQRNLQCLANGALIKNSLNECWKHEWPPNSFQNSIDIVMKVKSRSQIDSIRFWPISFDSTLNMRHVIIMLDQNVLYDQDLPNDFGTIIPLKLFDEMGKSLVKRTVEETFSFDDYGVFPYKSALKVEIQLLESYKSKTEIGIQHIGLYDNNGAFIPLNVNENVHLFDSHYYQIHNTDYHLKNIFYNPNTNEQHHPWKSEIGSRIIISPPMPIFVSAIVFVTLKKLNDLKTNNDHNNSNDAESSVLHSDTTANEDYHSNKKSSITCDDIGAKKVSVLINNVKINTLKLRRDHETDDQELARTNIVFLHDNSMIKEKLIQKLTLDSKNYQRNTENCWANEY
ncbi:hypothetical protein TRFO_19330 [Tritrichomonas foetus]|uniref:KATNIP domain-containing protein n=1 Tax=Tritrichomonas foetus TaxID=1144522 RepID=A0A1J4KPI5_9EUKA|nr:hypothetical protein TRFO_19330 [Tritrichomonas foetus]|eukprot:OHT11333.1 hypothetical protein TRFO_19330 [Tritrichomonas foetus]